MERLIKEVSMIYPDLKTCILFFIKPYGIPRNIASIVNNSFCIYSCSCYSEIKKIEKCRIEDTYIYIFKREKVPLRIMFLRIIFRNTN